jgi:dishevelled associated activator of morphogenesis
MSRIPGYDKRLAAIYFMRKFNERMEFIAPGLKNIHTASKEVVTSSGLKQTLELILALGNFLNQGSRGGAFGFHLSSLLAVDDTKASSVKGCTLLHYIFELVDTSKTHFKEARNLVVELKTTLQAAKVSLVELGKELTGVKGGFADLELQLEWHRGEGRSQELEGDCFADVATEFVKHNKPKFAQLETEHTEAKEAFEQCKKIFAITDPKIGPQAFFGQFLEFILMIDRVRKENSTRWQREAEMLKRAETTTAEANRLKKEQAAVSTKLKEANFDDLLSALKSGECLSPRRSAHVGGPSRRTRPPRGTRMTAKLPTHPSTTDI